MGQYIQEKFTLEIDMGNSAMLESDDIARALKAVAFKVEMGSLQGAILDLNGNKVGQYAIQSVVRESEV